MAKKLLYCSFCGKDQEKVRKLIASSGDNPSHICEECIGLCNHILAEEDGTNLGSQAYPTFSCEELNELKLSVEGLLDGITESGPASEFIVALWKIVEEELKAPRRAKVLAREIQEIEGREAEAGAEFAKGQAARSQRLAEIREEIRRLTPE